MPICEQAINPLSRIVCKVLGVRRSSRQTSSLSIHFAMRLSFSVNNLATITSYSGLTPMINSFAVGSTLGIDDKRSYPPYRSYSIGFSIQF